MKFSTKLLSTVFALLLICSLAVGITACKDASSTTKDGTQAAKQVKFTFTVVHKDGTEKSFEITTDKTNVGDALVAEGLISGDEEDYGLYVKVVDGETADYSVDASYWAFYIGDEEALTGVDSTPVTDGGTYSFRYTK